MEPYSVVVVGIGHNQLHIQQEHLDIAAVAVEMRLEGSFGHSCPRFEARIVGDYKPPVVAGADHIERQDNLETSAAVPDGRTLDSAENT